MVVIKIRKKGGELKKKNGGEKAVYFFFKGLVFRGKLIY
jgi:hypothetical protein